MAQQQFHLETKKDNFFPYHFFFSLPRRSMLEFQLESYDEKCIFRFHLDAETTHMFHGTTQLLSPLCFALCELLYL